MKQQDLKYLPKENLAIKKIIKILYFLLIVTPAILVGQSNSERSTYALMHHVIGQDTIVKESMLKSIEGKIKEKKLTSEDSILFVEEIRNKKLRLYKETRNSRIEQVLKESIKIKDWKIRNHVKIEDIERIIEKVPDDRSHLTFLMNPKIEILDHPSLLGKEHHSFSSPLRIEKNQYLIYHSKFNGPLNAFEELIIFKVLKNGQYEIEKTILISIS